MGSFHKREPGLSPDELSKLRTICTTDAKVSLDPGTNTIIYAIGSLSDGTFTGRGAGAPGSSVLNGGLRSPSLDRGDGDERTDPVRPTWSAHRPASPGALPAKSDQEPAEAKRRLATRRH